MRKNKILIKKLKHSIVVSLSTNVLFTQNLLVNAMLNMSNVNYTLFYVLKFLIRFGLFKPLKS